MKKRGQELFGMSFSMIFGIIVMIAIIAVAFYAITYFLNLNKCAQVSIFFKDFSNEIDTAWKSDIYDSAYHHKIPSGIKKVCFGLISSPPFRHDVEGPVLDEISEIGYGENEENVFMYPPDKACDGEKASIKARNLDVKQGNSPVFYCSDVSKNNEIIVKISKGLTDDHPFVDPS